jgi:hypothetical protein
MALFKERESAADHAGLVIFSTFISTGTAQTAYDVLSHQTVNQQEKPVATATNLLKRRVMSGGGMLVGPATWALTSNNGTKGKIGDRKNGRWRFRI